MAPAFEGPGPPLGQAVSCPGDGSMWILPRSAPLRFRRFCRLFRPFSGGGSVVAAAGRGEVISCGRSPGLGAGGPPLVSGGVTIRLRMRLGRWVDLRVGGARVGVGQYQLGRIGGPPRGRGGFCPKGGEPSGIGGPPPVRGELGMYPGRGGASGGSPPVRAVCPGLAAMLWPLGLWPACGRRSAGGVLVQVSSMPRNRIAARV